MTTPIRLLFVDDEKDFLEPMAKYLNRHGCQCDTALSCGEALGKIIENHYEVVVMDVLMPGLSGLECMIEVKKILPDVEVIILTGHASVEGGLKGMKSGAFDYCLKPIDMPELLEKVQLAAKHRVKPQGSNPPP
jgi:two-component system, OmpR family, response regulator